jgi:type IV secretion system protein TrbC
MYKCDRKPGQLNRKDTFTMRIFARHKIQISCHRLATTVAVGALLAIPAYADSPWENAVNALQISFTGPIARGLSLVAIVVGGLMFAFGENDSKRMLAGIVFGIGMAIGAVNFMAWLFPS